MIGIFLLGRPSLIGVKFARACHDEASDLAPGNDGGGEYVHHCGFHVVFPLRAPFERLAGRFHLLSY